ncbi:hypothetical protein GE09DRAFT_1054407 [Coniochaeta sp. 2T2.1]|nr:hypothetical protein GE09DRAFT_1054407 [Coniochaeta sp. 2T2.1]
MGRADVPTGKAKENRREHVRHPGNRVGKRTPKKPAPAVPTPTRPRLDLPRMQDFAAVAPAQFAFPPNPLINTRIEKARTTTWQSLEGVDFSEPPFDHAEMTKLSAAFGFVADQPGAHDNFLRAFIGLFDRMYGNKTAYCNNVEANATFYAFIRLQHYNGLLGRARGDMTKPDQARALASIDTALMTKVVEALIHGRRQFLEKKEETVKDPNNQQPAVGNKGTTSTFSQAATALSLHMNTGLGLEGMDSSDTGTTNDNPRTAVDDWLSSLTIPTAGGSAGSKWSNHLLARPRDSIDTWNREKFVQRQERQIVDEWGRMFGKPSLFGA